MQFLGSCVQTRLTIKSQFQTINYQLFTINYFSENNAKTNMIGLPKQL